LDYDYNYYNELSELKTIENVESKEIFNIGINELLKKSNNVLIDISMQNLEIAKTNRDSKVEIEKLEYELDNAKLKFDNDTANSISDTNKIRLNIDSLTNKLNIFKEKIKRAEENIELYRKQLSEGSITLNDFVEKDLELINMNIEQLQTEELLKKSSLELDLKIGKSDGVNHEVN